MFYSRDSEKTLINMRTQSCYSRDKVDPPPPPLEDSLPAGHQRAAVRLPAERERAAPWTLEGPQFSSAEMVRAMFFGSGHFQSFEIREAETSQFLNPTERWAKTAASVIQAKNQHR